MGSFESGTFNGGNLGSQGPPLPASKVLRQGYWGYELGGMGQPRRPGGVRKNVAAAVACLWKNLWVFFGNFAVVAMTLGYAWERRDAGRFWGFFVGVWVWG